MSVYSIITYYITICIGTPIYIIGIVGNLINAGVFYTDKLRNPTKFLLFIVSCSNIFYLHVGLLFRILSICFRFDISILNVSCCKIRYGLLQLFALTSISCTIYTIIDQVFITSEQNKWRHLSRISLTKKITLLIIFLLILYTIPLVIFSDIIQNNDGKLVCTIFAYNLIFARYASYFNLPFIWSIIPIFLMLFSSILTYRNMRFLRNHFHRQRSQHQLTSMILLYIIFITIGMIPFACFFIYLACTLSYVKTKDRQALENLLENLVTIISYFSLSSSIFIYSFSSLTHRRQVKKFLQRIYQRHVQVTPQNDIRH